MQYSVGGENVFEFTRISMLLLCFCIWFKYVDALVAAGCDYVTHIYDATSSNKYVSDMMWVLHNVIAGPGRASIARLVSNIYKNGLGTEVTLCEAGKQVVLHWKIYIDSLYT